MCSGKTIKTLALAKAGWVSSRVPISVGSPRGVFCAASHDTAVSNADLPRRQCLSRSASSAFQLEGPHEGTSIRLNQTPIHALHELDGTDCSLAPVVSPEKGRLCPFFAVSLFRFVRNRKRRKISGLITSVPFRSIDIDPGISGSGAAKEF